LKQNQQLFDPKTNIGRKYEEKLQEENNRKLQTMTRKLRQNLHEEENSLETASLIRRNSH